MKPQESKSRRSVREEVARRNDRDVGKLGTPDVYYTVTNWNTPREEVIARRKGEWRGG